LGCAGLSQQGVEVGNPDPNGKKITILPPDREEVYVLQFQPAPAVRVTKILNGNYQSRLSEYAEFGQDLFVAVQFEEDGPIQFFLDVNEFFQIIEVIFNLGGVSQSVPFLEEDPAPACIVAQEDTAITIAQGLCSRIVACNESFACDPCVAQVLEVPGLGQLLGGSGDSTLKQNGEGIKNGAITVDPVDLRACLADIENIPCPLVEERFNDETVPNYNLVKELIPSPSCDNGVLKE
jgi:hypothetical protein